MADALCEICGREWKDITSFDTFPKDEWSVKQIGDKAFAKKHEIVSVYRSLNIIHKEDNGKILFNTKIEFNMEV